MARHPFPAVGVVAVIHAHQNHRLRLTPETRTIGRAEPHIQIEEAVFEFAVDAYDFSFW